MSKYTVNAGSSFDLIVERDLNLIISRCLKSKYASVIKSIVLMGSYGRGEGTAFQTPYGVKPFNDYDLVVVGSAMNEFKRRKVQKEFHRLEHLLSAELDITVDLFLHTENSLKRAESTLMNYEMKYGHMVVYGDDAILDLMPSCKNVDLSEATRLLLNRGKLLLDISKRIKNDDEFTEDELLLYKKYLNKVVLAMGDAALMASGYNTILYREKLDQIHNISGFTDRTWLIEEYQTAVAFKFIGDVDLLPSDIKISFEDIKEHFMKFYFEFEGVRLHKAIPGYQSYYSEMSLDKKALSKIDRFKNLYLNIKTFGLKEFLNHAWLLRHPRERLFVVFPLLLQSQLSLKESLIASRLEGCTQNFDHCVNTFYQLREKYL